MVDHPTVCCMCGDVGFPEKLFQCSKCLSRFQHSYCTNYYEESLGTSVCDWCQSEERSVRQVGLSKRSGGKYGKGMNRSEYSGDRIKESDRGENSHSDRGKNVSGAPSPRPAGRRYKLLKDVLC
ncbi:hypothetical protein AAC387_Pa08g0330 [Persea americana]